MRCYTGEDLSFQFYKLRYILKVTYLSYGDGEDEADEHLQNSKENLVPQPTLDCSVPPTAEFITTEV